MKKKITNDQIADFIKQCADEIRDDIDREIFVAQSHMLNAENTLVNSFSEEQLSLYKEYLQARQNYYDKFSLKHKLD